MSLLPVATHTIPLAVSSGSFWPQPTLDSLTHLSNLGVADVELVLQSSEFRMTFDGHFHTPFLRELMTRVDRQEVVVRSVHAPHMDAEHGHSLWARLAYLRQSLELCAKLGASILVTHPFHLFVSYEHTLDYLSGTLSDVTTALLPDLRSVYDQAAALGVVLTVENVKIWKDDPSGFFNVPENVAKFIHDVHHPAQGLTLDLVHAQMIGSLQSFIRMLAPVIFNLHIADLCESGQRVSPGNGILPWNELFPALCALPTLRLATVELTDASMGAVAQSLDFLHSHWVHCIGPFSEPEKLFGEFQ